MCPVLFNSGHISFNVSLQYKEKRKDGRSIGKELYVSNAKKAEEIIAYRKVGDHATNMPSAVWYMLGNVISILDNTGAAVVKYTYDAWGNHTISGTEATMARHRE